MITAEKLKEVNERVKKVEIKGKFYACVAARVAAFREMCPEGLITTEIISMQDGVVTMKASILDENGRLVATGFAQEKESSSYINKTSYIENCVPLDTQILTDDGWKYYYQLKPGVSKVWSLNMGTEKLELCGLSAVNIHHDRPLVEMKTSRFKVVCTPQHKWVGRTQFKPLQKVPTDQLTSAWKIEHAIRQEVNPTDKGRALGWILCDCDVKTANGMPSTAYINQSKHIDEVTRLFGEGRKTRKYNDNWLDNYEWIVPAEKARAILGGFGMADYRDLPRAMSSADINDVAGCFESMMLADGESRGFSSTYPELIEGIQIMCARLGIATTFVKERMLKNSTKPLYTIGIKKTSGTYFSEVQIRNIPPKDVWCPTTENGTWIMRQGTFVTITSNCETSAVGRALGMLGIGSDEQMASAEEVANAINNQNASRSSPKAREATPESKVDDLPSEEQKALQEPMNDAERALIEQMCEKLKWDPAKVFTGWPNLTKEQYGVAMQEIRKRHANKGKNQ